MCQPTRLRTPSLDVSPRTCIFQWGLGWRTSISSCSTSPNEQGIPAAQRCHTIWPPTRSYLIPWHLQCLSPRTRRREKHEENGAELTVQQRSPMRPVSLTHVTLQISNTIQLHEQLHQLPLVADRNTFNVESGNRKRQPLFPSIVPRYHLIRTPLRDPSRIPHVIGRYTGHHPAGRRKRKPQGYLTSDKRDTRVPTMASPLPPRHATEYFPHRQQEPHRSSLDWWV